MKNILVTGSNGLIGSTLTASFTDSYTYVAMDISSPENPVDITNPLQVQETINVIKPDAIVHLAAFTDVNAAYQQTDDTDGIAYKVNVIGTQNIVKAAQAAKIHLIHVSTAFVFDGEKKELYTEHDAMNPIEWYGYTKAKAEDEVQKYIEKSTILRIDFPFRFDTFAKPDIIRKIVANITSPHPFPIFINHYFGPTVIEDFIKVIDWVIRTETTGLFHASSGEQWSDYELAQLVNKVHKLNGIIKPGDLDEYLQRVNRPYQRNTAMDISKLKGMLDFKTLSIEEAIQKVTL